MKSLITLFLLLILLSCEPPGNSTPQQKQAAIEAALNDWHKAAAEADFSRYFEYMSEKSIFMGTDATEYWTKTEFMEFSRPYFERGRAWNFTPVNRHIYFSDNYETAWFDEKLDTPNLGPARGSGVLVQENKTWKIAHYNLAIPIPNAIVDTVVQQIERFHQNNGSPDSPE